MSLNKGFVIRNATGFLLIALVALFGIVGMTFWLGERAQVYFSEAIAARDARGSAVEFRNAVQAAESSQRGFMLTGNEIYLAPYDLAKTQAERQLDALRRALAADPQSEVMVRRLGIILAEKVQEMDRSIALKREGNNEEVAALIRSNRGKALMDEANIYVSGVVRAADERLTAGLAEQRANAGWLRTFSVIGGIVIVVVVGAASLSAFRYTRDLRIARDEVDVLNHELEERVIARTAELARANDEIRSFVHTVSHDLRAPLVNITGFALEIEASVERLRGVTDSTRKGDVAPEAAMGDVAVIADDLPEAVGYIRASTARMDRLIGAILKISREGHRTLRPEPLSLVEILQGSAKAIQHQLGEAQGRITIDADIPTLTGDRLSLEQVFGNLLDNAVKYRAKDRSLLIDVRASLLSDDRFAVEVADNGRGIAERDVARLFSLFSRFGPADQPGEGVGLAFVRSLVRNLGGEISVSSRLGEGTTFRVELPRRLPSAHDGAPGLPAAELA